MEAMILSVLTVGVFVGLFDILSSLKHGRESSQRSMDSIDISLKQIVGLLAVRLPEPTEGQIRTRARAIENRWASLDLQRLSLDERLDSELPVPLDNEVYLRALRIYRRLGVGAFLELPEEKRDRLRKVFIPSVRNGIENVLIERGCLDFEARREGELGLE